MAIQTDELKRVLREQAELYDRMVRSIWGDRLTLALTAAAMGGFGLGLLFHGKWGTRFAGTLFYAAAAGMELYAAMSPKERQERERAEKPRPKARAA